MSVRNYSIVTMCWRPYWRSQLGTRQVQLALGAENIGIEVGDPLPSARSDVEVAYRHLNLRRDVVPVELRVLVDDVGRRVVAELLVQADFLEFVEQRIGLSQVVGIAELADQIGRAQQQPLFLDQIVVLVRG